MSSDATATSTAGGLPVAGGLSAAQLEQFDRDGYLIIPDFFSSAEADSLKSHVDTLLSQLDLSTHPLTVFRTTRAGEQTADIAARKVDDKNRYFLDSADRVSYFFEEHAFDESGRLTVEKHRAINKIGHFLHVQDEPFRAFTHRPEVKALASSLGLVEPVVLQSMVICKQPRIGGEVVPHRDSTFLHTKPSTAIGLWFALEDCSNDNGCLSFVPGSHKDGLSDRRFVRAGVEPRATVNNPGFDPSAPPGPNNEQVDLQFTGSDRATYPDSAYVPAEVKRGTLVLIHGEVVHASTRNLSDRSRVIYTFHMIEAHGTEYPTTNWLQSANKFPRLLE